MATDRDTLLDETSETWTRVERAIWPDGPAHGHGSGEYAALKARIIATLRAPLDANTENARHRHRYSLVPVWTADSKQIDSWWWCTDHPAGEWVRIEDDADAAEAIPGWADTENAGALRAAAQAVVDNFPGLGDEYDDDLRENFAVHFRRLEAVLAASPSPLRAERTNE